MNKKYENAAKAQAKLHGISEYNQCGKIMTYMKKEEGKLFHVEFNLEDFSEKRTQFNFTKQDENKPFQAAIPNPITIQALKETDGVSLIDDKEKLISEVQSFYENLKRKKNVEN